MQPQGDAHPLTVGADHQRFKNNLDSGQDQLDRLNAAKLAQGPSVTRPVWISQVGRKPIAYIVG